MRLNWCLLSGQAPVSGLATKAANPEKSGHSVRLGKPMRDTKILNSGCGCMDAGKVPNVACSPVNACICPPLSCLLVKVNASDTGCVVSIHGRIAVVD